jgi:hypothetical protein
MKILNASEPGLDSSMTGDKGFSVKYQAITRLIFMPPEITVIGQSNKKIFFSKPFTRVEMYYNLYSLYFVTTNLVVRIFILEFLIHYAFYVTRVLNSGIYRFNALCLKSNNCMKKIISSSGTNFYLN